GSALPPVPAAAAIAPAPPPAPASLVLSALVLPAAVWLPPAPPRPALPPSVPPAPLEPPAPAPPPSANGPIPSTSPCQCSHASSQALSVTEPAPHMIGSRISTRFISGVKLCPPSLEVATPFSIAPAASSPS